MGKKKNATITVEPVAWDGAGRTLKCQAIAEFGGKRLYSAPMTDSESAVLSLMGEARAYLDLIIAISRHRSPYHWVSEICLGLERDMRDIALTLWGEGFIDADNPPQQAASK